MIFKFSIPSMYSSVKVTFVVTLFLSLFLSTSRGNVVYVTTTATRQQVVNAAADTLEQVVTVAAFAPEFEGGTSALYAYIAKNLNYPSAAKKAKTEGDVFISFVVEKDGSLSDLEVKKGVNGEKGELLEKEALHLVKKMPKWKPGKDATKNPVRVAYMLPIRFKIA